MPVDQQLLDILCCPLTKKDLKIVEPNRISQLNEQIEKGGIKYSMNNPAPSHWRGTEIDGNGKIVLNIGYHTVVTTYLGAKDSR